MSILIYPIIHLLIHRRSYGKYYKNHDKWVIPRKQWIEKSWGKPFSELSQETQIGWEEMWFWPPWKFNDIAGFLDIGMDIGNCMTANLYIKRKFFPKNRREKRHSGGGTLKNNEFLYYGEISKRQIEWDKNPTFISAIKEIIAETERCIKNLNKSFQILLPPFDWECIDFVKAAKQAREREQH